MVDLFQTSVRDMRSAVMLRPSGSLACQMAVSHDAAGTEGKLWLSQMRKRIDDLEREISGVEAEMSLRRSAIEETTVRT